MPTDRLKFALEAVEVGLWDWNVRTGELWWSDNLAAIHGMPAGSFDGTFERFLSFIHPDDRVEFGVVLDQAIRSGDDFSAEFRAVGSDGIARWIRGQGRVFRDQSGAAYRVIGIGYDISGKRSEQDALRQLGVIALASSDAIVTVDGAGTVTAWNPGAEHLFGYSASEMIGSSIARIAAPERAGEIERILSRLSLGERVDNFETERIRKDGSRVFVSISSGPLIDDQGRWMGAVTITRDISLRRREENRQRFLADVSNVLYATLDAASSLSALAELVVDRIADRCLIHLCSDDGVLELTSDTGRERHGASVEDDPKQFEANVEAVIRRGQSWIGWSGDGLDDGRLDGPDGEAQSLLNGRVATVIIVPLTARDRTLGTISLLSSGSTGFDANDLSLATEVARRAALAVENARLFSRVAAAERQLRLVSDSLPALVSYIGADFRYHFANRRYHDYVGIPGEQLVGRLLEDVLQKEDFERVEPMLAAALSGKAVRYEMDVTYAKAGVRRMELEYVPDIGEDGAVRGAVALIIDVTERAREQTRASRLHAMAASLAESVTEEDVARSFVEHGVAAVGGNAGAIAVLSDDGASFTLRAVHGYPSESLDNGPRVVSDETAVGVVVRTRKPVFLRSPEERFSRFPLQVALGPGLVEGAFAALPLEVEGRVLGALVVIFPDPREFGRADTDLMMTLANLCAQSLDRARLYDAERRARSAAEADRARVSFLAEASRILAGSLDGGIDFKRVMAIAVSSLCDWCTIHLFEEDGRIRRLGVVHRDPNLLPVAQELERRYADLPARCWRSVRAELNEGRSWFEDVVSEERLRAETRDEEHRQLLQRLGFSSEMVVPMVAGGRLVGSVTFARGPGSPPFVRDDLSLAEEIGSRIALALDNVRLFAGAQASESRYRTLFEEASEAILIVDPDGIVRGGNEAAARLMGADREALYGQPIGSIVGGWNGSSSSTGGLPFLQPGWHGELEAIRADGSVIPVEIHATLVDLPSGSAYLVTMRDVSERRALERLQRDFLAMVTHDLRSPLSAIRVHSQLMRRKEQYSAAGVDAIIGQTDRMAGLINALADVVRTDSGRLDLNRTSVDLVELVERIAVQERSYDPGRVIEVRAQTPVVGMWDADRVAQIVANLIGNAIKYSPASSTVIVDVTQVDGEAVVAVIDAGAGIAAEHQPRLFERFYRADVTGAGGLGLGLYIARMLTEAHGGRIGVESAPGLGSTFTVRLPLADG